MGLMVVTEPMVVTGPVMVTEPVVVLEAVITESVMTVAMELVAAMTMDAAMYTAFAPNVEASTTTASIGQSRRAEQQGEHEPESGKKRYSERSAQHSKSIHTRMLPQRFDNSPVGEHRNSHRQRR
jgi:hypothetical protein